MRLILDTHAFFWWLADERRMSSAALAAVEEADNEVLVSAVVAWELATKTRLGKWPGGKTVVDDIERAVVMYRLVRLPISLDHARLAGLMAWEHRDPFDRMLAAQSAIEAAPLVSADPVFAAFGTTVLW